MTDELIDAGVQAMHDLFNRPGAATNREYAAAVVEAVEGLVVPADELTTLREQVADLPHAPACQADTLCWCPISDVLELIDDRLLMLDQATT